MTEISSKSLRSYRHHLTIVNSFFHFLKLTSFDIHVDEFSTLIERMKIRHTIRTFIILSYSCPTQ